MPISDVLLITNQRATEVDGVIDRCRAHGLSIERINLCQYPEKVFFSWSPADERNFDRENLAHTLSAKAAWFHDPGRYTIARSLKGHARELAFRDCEGFWEGATHASSAVWLNRPDSIFKSSKKLLQLAVAKNLSIPIPDTLVSNDPELVRSFFDAHGGAILKSISNGYSIYGAEQLKLYSRFFLLPNEELIKGLAFSPLIFQQRVLKHRELRVTIVDDMCFGMVADTMDLNEQDIDIRQLDYSAETGRFSGIAVPATVENASLKLMRNLGLSYAGLDWVEDKDGRWLFLEINCMGSFKWSELCGAGDITGALSEALIRRAELDA